MSQVVKQGLRQVQKGLSERVSNLEQSLAQILFGVNQRFQSGDSKTAALEEQVAALIELNGAEDVARIVMEKRTERAKAQSEQEKATLQEGIDAGYVIPADTVAEKSVVVVRYFDKDGGVVEPGRAQLVMPGVIQKYRELLLGKGVGLKMDLDEGGSCELLEIYNVDEDKAKAVMAERAQAAQAKAAADASTATEAAGETAAADEAQADSGDQQSGQ
jgi:hypothetical protein